MSRIAIDRCSRIAIDRCNSCGLETKDYHNEIGWIKIDSNGFHVSGGRQKGGMANTVRYIIHITASVSEGLDFCCAECLLKYLFFSEGYFNSIHDSYSYDDFKEKMKMINVSIPGKLYEAIVCMFEHIKSMIN